MKKCNVLIKVFVITILLFPGIFTHAQEVPEVVAGKIERVENFKSKYNILSRNVDIWLPEGYSTQKKYAVLYMHDGQNIFDPKTTWNHQSWDVDDAATKLMKEGKIKDIIIVGVWNTEDRHSDYFPQKPFQALTQSQVEQIKYNKEIKSDDYLKFLVYELKPYIDNTYSTKKDRDNTFIAGSSMGGLISMYAICEYPEVFGGAGCISTHWPGINVPDNPIPKMFFDYLKKNLPDPKNHKFYYDHGDKTVDSLYPELQKKADIIMKEKGYNEKNWITKVFPGQDHSEKSWSSRFDETLLFLLQK